MVEVDSATQASLNATVLIGKKERDEERKERERERESNSLQPCRSLEVQPKNSFGRGGQDSFFIIVSIIIVVVFTITRRQGIHTFK